MSAKKNAGDYERVEVPFSKSNEEEMKLYKHLEDNSKLLGKAKYIKQLILKDLLKGSK